MKILALESSTTSAKAMLYDTKTSEFSVITKPYEKDYVSNMDIGQAEQVYLEMMACGRSLAEGQDIDVITLGGTWHSLVLCDKFMSPATPVFLWNYMEAADICKEYRKDPAYVKEFYGKTGCMVNAVYPAFKIELLKSRGIDLSDKYIMSQGSYQNYRMTGERISTRCLSSGSGLLNTHSKNYDPDVLKERGLKEEQLNRLVDSEEAFPLLPAAAAMLGVKDGIPVLATNSDGGLNQLGAGAAKKDYMTFSVGTSGAIRLTTAGPVIPEKPSTWCYLSPKGHLSGAATNGCTNCTDWAKEKLFPKGVSYDEIEQEIQDREDGPIFLPFLFGERCPGWNDERRGGFVDVLARHSAGDLYYSVQEGVLFNLYHCYRTLTELNGKPKRILLSGGILKSKAWTQMCADIFGAELSVNDAEQGSLMGGVVLGMEKLGVISKAEDFDAKVTDVIAPNPKKAEHYARRYEKYLAAYERS